MTPLVGGAGDVAEVLATTRYLSAAGEAATNEPLIELPVAVKLNVLGCDVGALQTLVEKKLGPLQSELFPSQVDRTHQ